MGTPMPYDSAWKPPVPKTKVYRFGVLWFWKCRKPRCAGGRERVWETAVAKANEHVKSHTEEA